MVIFLDADDTLHPQAAAASPPPSPPTRGLAKVQFRMEVIDAEGRRPGRSSRPRTCRCRSGDLRAAELAYPFDLAWMATSANAFRAEALRHDPADPRAGVPQVRRRLVPGSPDDAARQGRLAGGGLRLLPGARRQQLRAAAAPRLDLAHLRQTIGFAQPTSETLLRLAAELDLPHPDRILSLADLANRMVSLRLRARAAPGPERQPVVPARRLGSRGPTAQQRLGGDEARSSSPGSRRSPQAPRPRTAPRCALLLSREPHLAQPSARPASARRPRRARAKGLRCASCSSPRWSPTPRGSVRYPKLLHAQLLGLRERHEVTLVAPASAKTPDRPRQPSDLLALRPRCPFHRPAALALRLAALAGARPSSPRRWATKDWPWRVVCGAAGVQPLIDRLARRRDIRRDRGRGQPDVGPALPGRRARRPHRARGGSRPGRAVARRAALRATAGGPQRRATGAAGTRSCRQAWRRFDLLQVFSEGDARRSREPAPELAGRVRVNPYGMVLPPAPDPADEVAGTILFTGTFSPSAQPRCRALAGQRDHAGGHRDRARARLRIVGSSPPREVLELAGPADRRDRRRAQHASPISRPPPSCSPRCAAAAA